MRKLAAFAAHEKPDLLSICEMPSGDSLSFATRFALQYAYRGRQALFWNGAFVPQVIHTEYLPPAPAQMFRRRGFLRVDGELRGMPCTLAAVHFARSRAAHAAELRFVRAQMAGAHPASLLFAHLALTAAARVYTRGTLPLLRVVRFAV